MKECNKLKDFKNLKFYSQDEQQILEAVSIFKKLGYRVVDGHFNINSAKENGGVCAWDDREITSGWLADDDFEQVTLEDLKEMVGEDKEVLWLNKETLEECYLDKISVFPYHSSWVKVPEGATFATGDKDNFLFRKDGWYYEDGEWVETNVLLKHFPEYEHIKLFWVKGDIKARILSNNFTVTWEKVFGEKFVDSVSKAVRQNKETTMKKDGVFTLERLLGCEVKINCSGVTGYVTDITNNGYFLHICCGSNFDVVSKHHLTFFTEDGDELTFDEYVNIYYGDSL